MLHSRPWLIYPMICRILLPSAINYLGTYFLRHHPLEIKWHVDTILGNPTQQTLVKIRQAPHSKTTKVFVYCDESPNVFSQVTGALGSLGLSILNAEIFSTKTTRSWIPLSFRITTVNQSPSHR